MLVFAFAYAQEFGSIRGKVFDKEGNVLPGVNVTLTGLKTAPRSVITSSEGNFRFMNLPVGEYVVKFELQGFKTIVREKLVVSFGRDVNIEPQHGTGHPRGAGDGRRTDAGHRHQKDPGRHDHHD